MATPTPRDRWSAWRMMWREQLGEAISFRDPLPPLGRKDTFSHLPALHWSFHLSGLCVAQSKIRAKLGWGQAQRPVCPGSCFIYLLSGDRKGYWPCSRWEFCLVFFFFFLFRSFFPWKTKRLPQQLWNSPLFNTNAEEEETHPEGGCCSEYETAGTSDRVPGTLANP